MYVPLRYAEGCFQQHVSPLTPLCKFSFCSARITMSRLRMLKATSCTLRSEFERLTVCFRDSSRRYIGDTSTKGPCKDIGSLERTSILYTCTASLNRRPFVVALPPEEAKATNPVKTRNDKRRRYSWIRLGNISILSLILGSDCGRSSVDRMSALREKI